MPAPEAHPYIRFARLAGAMYLVQISTGTFSELFARNPFINHGDSGQTALNILASEHFFRMGIASDLVTYSAVLIATWALFVILKPINPHLAYLALFFRLIELSLHFNVTLNSLAALRLLSSAEFLKTMEPGTLHALAQHTLGVQGAGLRLGFIPLGIGSAVFAFLLLKSNLIPRGIASLGIFASVLLAVYSLVNIIFPNIIRFLYVPMLPMGL